MNLFVELCLIMQCSGWIALFVFSTFATAHLLAEEEIAISFLVCVEPIPRHNPIERSLYGHLSPASSPLFPDKYEQFPVQLEIMMGPF